MKYERYLQIYQNMGNILRAEFIDRYNLVPGFMKPDQIEIFDRSMEKFILDHHDNLTIQNACMIFPELENIPHPDDIPESWGLNPYGKDLLKAAYIEKLELEICKLNEQINVLEEQMVQSTKRNPTPIIDIPNSIYRKMGEANEIKNRWRSLSEDEINWIYENVSMTKENKMVLDLLCQSKNLKEVAYRMHSSLSKIKHHSVAIAGNICKALEKIVKTETNKEIENDRPPG